MRIVAWNLKNIGQTKLSNTFSALIGQSRLGNCVLDYMMKVVMADAAWTPYVSDPADVFLIVELKSGGKTKGAPATGTAIPTLTTILAAMNKVAQARKLTGTYAYAGIDPLVIGYHECVGIVYNTKRLTYAPNSAAVLRDATGYVGPRAPFYAAFTTANNNRLAVVGIHAPPPSGSQQAKFRLPVLYTQRLAEVPELNQAAMNAQQEPLCIGGDFNCDRRSSFTLYVKKKATQVTAFSDLVTNYQYSTQLANGTLSSMRRTLGTVKPPVNTNYLSGAYDNIFAKALGLQNPPTQRVLDLIGNARDTTPQPATALYPARVAALFNAYWVVSDHMPVEMTY